MRYFVFLDSERGAGVIGADSCLSSRMEAMMYAISTALAATMAVIAAYVELPVQSSARGDFDDGHWFAY